MTRIAWALALAFVAHLVLFWVRMPEQQQAQLSLAGSAHVSVRLAQSRPEPVDKVIAEPKPDPVPVVDSEPERVEIAEVVEETVAPTVLPPIEKVGVKAVKDVRENEEKAVPAVKEQTAARESTPVADAEKQQTAEPVPPVSAADGPESAGSTSSATQAIGQAEPLTALNRPPDYPILARRRGWEGTVVLEVDVERDGMVKDVRIQTSSSYTLLDKEALAAVRKWRFTPGSRNGEPVPSKVLVPVHFMFQSK